MRRYFLVFANLAVTCLGSVCLLFIQTGVVSALSADQTQLYEEGINYFDAQVTASCGIGGTALVGSDNEQKAFNFFRAKGLNDTQAAATIGNLMWESHLDPTIMQKGGDSQNPADADPQGWGIAQWTPGSKVTNIAQTLYITTPIYSLDTQLNIVWNEMTGQAPTGYQNLVKDFTQSSLPDAVAFFQQNFESGTDFQNRLSEAQAALQQYGGSSTPAGGQTSSCAMSSAMSPNCQVTTGNARILCDAEKYDPVSYSESYQAGHQGGVAWHQSCPTIDASCVLDCSGLVNIAVYDVFGVDLREDTHGELADTQYWKVIPFNQVQPGDLIQPGEYSGDHVEIVDHVQGNTIYTFGAHTNSVKQPDQVGPTSYTAVPQGDVYLHYIGPGSS